MNNRGQKLLCSHYISSIILESFNCFAGVFRKIFYTPSLLLESFKPLVGVFLKKFIKFSHKMVSRFFQSPSIYVRKLSLHLCFLTIFLSYNCYYEKYSDGSVKNIQDEIPFDLPVGWAWSRISSFSIINPRNSLSNELEVSFIPMPLISEGYKNEHSFEIKEWKNVKTGFTHFAEGDIGVAKITPCFENKKSVIFNGLQNGFGAGTTELHIIRVFSKAINAKYVLWNLKTNAFIADGINAFSGAVGQKRISKEFIADYLLPIPPIQQQNKIVNVVDDCFLSIDAIENSSNSLDNIKALLKSKILELAIQGKLVPQDESDEPASVLLEHIRAERKAKLGKKYVESYIYKGDDNCYYEKVGTTVKNITDQIPFSIPQNWSFVRLKELAKVVSGVSYDKRDICNDGIRIIRGGNISNLSIVLLPDDVFLPQKYYDNEKEVKTEDIVIVASTGSKIAIGRPAFADKSFPQTQIGAFLRIVRPYVPNVYQYLKCLFASNYYREHISDLVHGNTINNIKTEYLDEFIIPFPPIREQKEIANKVKILMDILKGGD